VRQRRQAGLLLGLITALVAVPAASVSAGGHEGKDPGWCQPGRTVAASVLPARLAPGTCDRTDVTIRDGAAGVALPARGITVSAAVLTVDGDQVLTVARELDGSLSIRRGEATRAASAPAALAATSGCSSSAYVDLGYQVGGAYAWKYNGKGAPANVAGSALANLKTATGNVANGRDDCGLAGQPRTGQSFTGTTTKAPGITSDANCQSGPDQVNVTGWKPLTANGVLAVTCTYSFSGSNDVADSDAAINSKFRWVTSAAGCNGAYDLQGVMTHERGHTYGLGHPAAVSANGGLTMYPSVRACDFSKRTLGRGDLLGLFHIYGKA